ncbi:MAG: hypothetical protein M3N47_03810 [Chloroflexota bacterium]|nr:hypothetical protein [Chloroflexota bacterium]
MPITEATGAVSIDPVLQRLVHTGTLSIAYDQLSDSLRIYPFGRPVPSFVEPVDDVIARLVSLENETEETGLLIEAFLAVAVHQRPWLNPIPRLLKLPDRLPGDFSHSLSGSDTIGSKEQVEPDEQWLQPAFAAVSKLLLELKE